MRKEWNICDTKRGGNEGVGPMRGENEEEVRRGISFPGP